MTPAGEGTNALSGGPATLIAAAATQFSRIFQIVDAVFFPHFFLCSLTLGSCNSNGKLCRLCLPFSAAIWQCNANCGWSGASVCVCVCVWLSAQKSRL